MPAIHSGTAWNTLLVPGEKMLIKTGMAATGARGGATQEGSQRGMCGGTQPEERHRHWGPPGPPTCAYLAFCPAPPLPHHDTVGKSIRSTRSDPLLHPMLAGDSISGGAAQDFPHRSGGGDERGRQGNFAPLFALHRNHCKVHSRMTALRN